MTTVPNRRTGRWCCCFKLKVFERLMQHFPFIDSIFVNDESTCCHTGFWSEKRLVVRHAGRFLITIAYGLFTFSDNDCKLGHSFSNLNRIFSVRLLFLSVTITDLGLTNLVTSAGRKKNVLYTYIGRYIQGFKPDIRVRVEKV